MFSELLGTLSKISQAATNVAPAIGALKSVVDTIDDQSATQEGRNAMLLEFAADSAEIAANIMRAMKDGHISDEEYAQLKDQLRQLIPGC